MLVRARKAIRDAGKLAVVVQSAGYFVVGYILAQLVTPHLVAAVLVVILSLGACAVLVWIRFSAAGRAVLASNRATDWSGTAAVALLLVAVGTTGFAVLSATLYTHGVGS